MRLTTDRRRREHGHRRSSGGEEERAAPAVRYPAHVLCTRVVDEYAMARMSICVGSRAGFAARTTSRTSSLCCHRKIYDSNLHCGPGDVIYSLRTNAALLDGDQDDDDDGHDDDDDDQWLAMVLLLVARSSSECLVGQYGHDDGQM